jgi:hypothetical protein
MFRSRRQVAGTLVSLAAGTLAVSMAGATAPALAAQPASVSTTPAPGTPQLAPNGKTEQIRQIVQCGNMMYAVGTFTKISQGGKTFNRRNAFSFKATAPYTVSHWEPGPSGEVNSIAFKGSNCHSAYLGGSFRHVHGKSARNIVKVNTTTGARRRAFAHHANKPVETLVVHKRHLLVGGFFKSINGSGRNFYASLNTRTGRDDRYLRLRIHGHYVFPGATANRTRVYNQQLSPDGRHLLAEGDFTSVRGKHREQIFMLTLGRRRARVTKWHSTEFYQPCADAVPFYVQAASWSPDGRTVYVAATGVAPFNLPDSSPRSGLCDAASAFPATHKKVSSRWINYTGCDALYSTAADSSTAYFAGHERWADNKNGCNLAGTGAVVRQGITGIDPSSGLASAWNPSRSRGIGADDMLRTSAGLWIASDNFAGGGTGDQCGGVGGHAGLCFLPN